MCAAKGELFAVLSLPAHYREREAIAHASRLNSGPGETSPATYGALYHPWPVDRRADARYFAFPPDGPVMGVLAARAFERGAWIAPANEVMNAFVALRPVVPMESWLALLEAQVNILRLDARGFLLMSEDTLATEEDAELRPICVRRLLILLRRLALRRGANYVFEPHDDTLRRTVQRAFHETLSELYARGAFAGRTPGQSFQVVTDETINTAQGVDAGRFFVELKVAPSLPLSFLTVRLRQVGERLTASEGR
jgi:phage tail sheath protein FI